MKLPVILGLMAMMVTLSSYAQDDVSGAPKQEVHTNKTVKGDCKACAFPGGADGNSQHSSEASNTEGGGTTTTGESGK